MEWMILLIFIMVACFVLVGISQQRYSGPGEEADSRNREEYGVPARSLYTSSEVLTLHHRIEITDGGGCVVYRAETQFPSIHDKTDIYGSDGRHVAHIERKLVSLHERRYVEMENGNRFMLSNELFHLIKDVTNLEGLGWRLEGNLLQLNFSIRDVGGELIALVSQKAFSIHDKYAADIYKPEHEEEVVAILIALQHMIRDRQGTSASVGSSS